MATKIVTTFFSSARGDENYRRLLCAFAASRFANSELPLEVLTPGRLALCQPSRFKIDSNTWKLEAINRFAQESPDDLLILDADMLILREISPAIDGVTDFAYTLADYDRYPPFNGGFLVCRATERGRAELAELTRRNAILAADPELHRVYRQKYQGINQSAMGWMLEDGHKWDALPMSVWNVCEPWPVDKRNPPAVIHVKAKLAQLCLAGDTESKHAGIVRDWMEYENRTESLGQKRLFGRDIF